MQHGSRVSWQVGFLKTSMCEHNWKKYGDSTPHECHSLWQNESITIIVKFRDEGSMQSVMHTQDILCKVNYIAEEICTHINNGWDLLTQLAIETGNQWPNLQVATMPIATAKMFTDTFKIESVSPFEIALGYSLSVSPVPIEIDPQMAPVFQEDFGNEDVPVDLLASWPMPACYIKADGVWGSEMVKGIAVVPDRCDGKLLVGIDIGGTLLPFVIHLDEFCVFGYEPTIDGILACTDGCASNELARAIVTFLLRFASMLEHTPNQETSQQSLETRVSDVIWGQLLQY